MINPYVDWLLRYILSAVITFLFAGFLFAIVNRIHEVGKSLIDHFFKRRQEYIDKMILEGLPTNKHHN